MLEMGCASVPLKFLRNMESIPYTSVALELLRESIVFSTAVSETWVRLNTGCSLSSDRKVVGPLFTLWVSDFRESTK